MTPGLPLRSLISFTVQLALMLENGIPIMRSMAVLRSSEEPGVTAVVDHLAASLNQGQRLSSALARLPESFSRIYVKLVQSGESSGRLTEVLRGMAQELERHQRQLGRLQQALVYPSAVFLISGSMAAFMVYYMLPKFLAMFHGFGQELPFITRVLMEVVENRQLRFCLPLIFVVFPALLYHQRHRPDVMLMLQQVKYGLPVVGPINRQTAMARLCSNLSMMGHQGVLLTEALKLLEGTTGYQMLDQALPTVSQDIQSGQTLGQALGGQSIFPALVVQSVLAGESFSDVFGALRNCSVLLEEQVEYRIEAMLSMLEPLVMGFMGVLVGFIVLATFLPIYQMAALKL